MSGPLDGLRPAAPPPELRARVLAAAREAAEAEAPGLLELLVADRVLRLCFGIIAALAVAHVIVGGASPVPSPSALPLALDETEISTETGLTAVEQLDELEPAL